MKRPSYFRNYRNVRPRRFAPYRRTPDLQYHRYNAVQNFSGTGDKAVALDLTPNTGSHSGDIVLKGIDLKFYLTNFLNYRVCIVTCISDEETPVDSTVMAIDRKRYRVHYDKLIKINDFNSGFVNIKTNLNLVLKKDSSNYVTYNKPLCMIYAYTFSPTSSLTFGSVTTWREK